MAEEGQQPKKESPGTKDSSGTLHIENAKIKAETKATLTVDDLGNIPTRGVPRIPTSDKPTSGIADSNQSQPSLESGAEQSGEPSSGGGANQPSVTNGTSGTQPDAGQAGTSQPPQPETNKPSQKKSPEEEKKDGEKKPEETDKSKEGEDKDKKSPSAEATGDKPSENGGANKPNIESGASKKPFGTPPSGGDTAPEKNADATNTGNKPANKPGAEDKKAGLKDRFSDAQKKFEETRNKYDPRRRISNFVNKYNPKKILGDKLKRQALQLLLKNPYFLAMVAAMLVTVVIIVVSIAIFAAPTGSSAQQNTNPVTNHDELQELLAKVGSIQAKAGQIQKDKATLDKALEIDAKTPGRTAEQITAINKLKAAIDAIKSPNQHDYSNDSKDQPELKALDEAISIYRNKVGSSYPNVTSYINYINTKLTQPPKTPPYTAYPVGKFLDWRGAGGARVSAGLHCGYDIAAVAGTQVLAGWEGTWYGKEDWGNNEYAEFEKYTEGNATYEIGYGHLTPSSIVPHNTGDKIHKGDLIGTIARNHVDIKFFPLVNPNQNLITDGANRRNCVDWGTSDYFTEAQIKAQMGK